MKTIFILVALLYSTACTSSVETSSYDLVYIYKYDGSVQCSQQAISLQAMEIDLVHAGIQVFEMRKASDNRLYPAVCGGKTGRMNVYSIKSSDLTRAQQLGFRLLKKNPFQ